MIPESDGILFGENSDESPLLCPGCKGNYLHHGLVEVFNRNKEDGGEGFHFKIKHLHVNTDENMVDNPSSRRDGILIHFSCEFCGAEPVMAIMQHKGQTFMRFQPSTPPET